MVSHGYIAIPNKEAYQENTGKSRSAVLAWESMACDEGSSLLHDRECQRGQWHKSLRFTVGPGRGRWGTHTLWRIRQLWWFYRCCSVVIIIAFYNTSGIKVRKITLGFPYSRIYVWVSSHISNVSVCNTGCSWQHSAINNWKNNDVIRVRQDYLPQALEGYLRPHAIRSRGRGYLFAFRRL